MSKSKSLVFFGSGPVAAASLSDLVNFFEIEAVITKPKPAGHRGETPVLDLAKKLALPTRLVTNKEELVDVFGEAEFKSLAALVVDFGIIIPIAVINYFPKGIINSHFSLLPQWRGADPITFALLSGQKKTGVSLMLIDEGLDTGKLLAQATYDIELDENIVSLTTNLVDLSNQTLKEVVPLYLADQIEPIPQDVEQEPTYSKMLTKADGVVDRNKPAKQIEREVRAYLGWPKSQAEVFGHKIIVTKARVAENANDGDLVIKCSPGWLEIQELTGPSGRRMSGADFIRGYRRSSSLG